MKLIIGVGDKELIKEAVDEYEDKALRALGDVFGYNQEIRADKFLFVEMVTEVVTSLIYFRRYLVAADVLRFVAMLNDSDYWKVVE